MKSASVQRILDAYDEAFKLLGFPSFSAGISQLCEELQKQRNQLKVARNKRGLEAMLAKEPEPSPGDLDAIVGSIRLIPYQLKKGFSEAVKALPKAPGGRPRVLTEKDAAEICVQIGALIGSGVSLPDAVKRMAQHYDVGEITIRRVWQKRGKPTTDVSIIKDKG